MRSPGQILLVSCYELGHQPMGLAWPIAFLERAGYAPLAVDLGIESLEQDPPALTDAAISAARFIGISVPMHTALRIGLDVARRVRGVNPAAHVCFYGLYAPLHCDLLLGELVELRPAAGVGEASSGGGLALADSVIGGEYKQALVDTVVRVEMAAEGEAGPLLFPVALPLARLPFPVPSRSRLAPLSRYARVLRADGTSGLAGEIEASRGCLHLCRHCPIPSVYGGRFFVVPEAVVLEDARRLVSAGATHLTFGDPDFLNGPRHAMAIARALHAEHPSLTFDVTAKIEHLLAHRSALPELASLGCVFVVSAVESLSDRVLAILDKGHTRADVAAAIALTRACGIALRPSLVPFTPWETMEGYLDLFHFIDAHALWDAIDPVHLTIRLLVPPGSLLVEHPEMLPHLGRLDREALTLQWTHPDPRMDALQGRAARIAGDDARAGTPSRETYVRLRELAHSASGRARPESRPRFPTDGSPKLSETWFC